MFKRALFTLIICFLAVFQTSCDALEEALANFSGCTLEDAPNYDTSKSIPCTTNCINEQTGSNCCCEEIIYGCTDATKANYSETANAACNDSGTDNDCCITDLAGCMDQGANNYNPEATTSDTSCLYNDYGCMNSDA